MTPITSLVFLTATIIAQLGQIVLASDDKGQIPLAKEPIQNGVEYSSNSTAKAPTIKDAWHESHICSGIHCVYSNPGFAGGRGIAVITTSSNLPKIQRAQTRQIGQSYSGHLQDSPPFYEKEEPNGVKTLIANTTIKRGTQLMAWAPVLIVHMAFMDDATMKEKRRLLEAAIKLLPEETRSKYLSQRDSKGGHDIKDILLAYPFEGDFGAMKDPQNPNAHEKHYFNYPEVSAFAHDCRPNVAFYLDDNFGHRTAVARKIEPGEKLTLSYVDPFLPQAQRQQWVKRWRGSGCSCAHCSAGKSEVKKSDARLKEIKELEEKIYDTRIRGTTLSMVNRFLELYKQERLQARLADAYWTAALGYNHFGEKKLALKYVNLAIQAAIIERGADAMQVIEMSIMARDPEGHYSWKARL